MCLFLFTNLSLLKPIGEGATACMGSLTQEDILERRGGTVERKTSPYCFGAADSQMRRRETTQCQVQWVSCGVLPSLHSEGFGKYLSCQMLPSLSLINRQFTTSHRGPPQGKTKVAQCVFNDLGFPLWTPLWVSKLPAAPVKIILI